MLRSIAAQALMAALAAGPGLEAAAEPLPRLRPQAPADAPRDAATAPQEVPLPKARPDEADRPASPEPQAEPDPPPAPVDAGAEIACRWRLKQLGVAYEELPPIDGEGACGAAAPVRVSGLGGGIELTPAATLNCRMAEALARWTREVVRPAAERFLGATPTGLANAASYVCRPRNNRPGAKLSEHATANAIDIGGIVLDEGRAVPVLARGDDEARERAFQRAIRRGACEHFATVIGPGTNVAHATHFHFDLAERRGGYRLCE